MDLVEKEVLTENIEGLKVAVKKEKLNLNSYVAYSIVKQATINSNVAIVQFLLDQGFQINKLHNQILEKTPLHFAVENGNIDLVKLLLDKGANVNDEDENNETPLTIAAKNGRIDFIDLMLPLADPNGPFIWKAYDSVEKGEEEEEKVATEDDDSDEYTDADSDEEKEDEKTPYRQLSNMHVACMGSNVNIVKRFLQSGASFTEAVSLTSECFPGYTSLHLATHFERLETVELLIKAGASVTKADKNENTPVHLAFNQNNQRIIDLLLTAHRFNPLNPVNRFGLSPFHIACKKDSPEIVEIFLLHGIGVNLQINNESEIWPGYTSLHIAVKHQCQQVVKKLLSYKADVTRKNKHNQDVLELAKEIGNPKITDLICDFQKISSPSHLLDKTLLEIVNLISIKVDSTELTNYDYDDVEFDHGCIDIFMPGDRERQESVTNNISKLVQEGKSINEKLSNSSPIWPGCTLLHVAIEYENLGMVKLLLKLGADITAGDSQGNTPFHLAHKKLGTQAYHEMNIEDINKLLLAYHFDIMENPVNDMGLSHLHLLCSQAEKKNKFLMKMLLSNRFLQESEKEEEATLKFIKNFIRDNLDCINNPVNQNALFYPGYTPLHFSIKNEALDLIKFLLNRPNIDLSIENSFGKTPLDMYVEMLSELFIPSILLNEKNYLNIVRSLIMNNKTSDIQYQHGYGLTILHIECIMGKQEIVMKRIKDFPNEINKAISLSSKLWPGDTPLHTAVRYRCKNVAKILLKAGANSKATNANLNTPLHLLFTEDLDEQMPRKNRRDSHPLEWCQMFLNNGADVNACNFINETPLFLACKKDFPPNLLEYLLKHNADLNICNYKGDTPITILLKRKITIQIKEWMIVIMEHVKKLLNSNSSLLEKNVEAYQSLIKILFNTNPDD